mgnify:CR=1 FL=1
MRVMWCESRGDPDAVNAESGASGQCSTYLGIGMKELALLASRERLHLTR